MSYLPAERKEEKNQESHWIKQSGQGYIFFYKSTCFVDTIDKESVFEYNMLFTETVYLAINACMVEDIEKDNLFKYKILTNTLSFA